MELLSGISASSSALTAQRPRLDVIAQNIANANTTRGPDGLPYQRRTVTFETVLAQTAAGNRNASGLRVGASARTSRPASA